MERDANNSKRIPGSVKLILFLLIVIAIHFGRKYYIASQHPYKDLDVIGAWDYSYSVTFDVNKKPLRTDKELFSLEMYTETEIILNDDGTFRICIENTEITGTWSPDEHNSNVFLLLPNESTLNEVIEDNEIRWDKGEDKLCIGLSKGTVPENISHLFNDDEENRYIFCKTYRDNVRVVYKNNDDYDYDEDEWDDGDNGLPFNYHP